MNKTLKNINSKWLAAFLLVTNILFFSCGGNKLTGQTELWTIASQRTSCTGVALQQCYLVKRDGNSSWELFYNEINGFQYKEGYEYRIEVEVIPVENPPADGSSQSYTLKKVLSEEQKHSEGLPE